MSFIFPSIFLSLSMSLSCLYSGDILHFFLSEGEVNIASGNMCVFIFFHLFLFFYFLICLLL